ncbi:hypothetical protein ACIF8T_39630 [Streptomyces sp. NPDC085946]|uniref:hypothetical protein n=1 Tax=Streptomyces sp. NPDC085946 TaxID=3365744 RepID=UPI0037D35CD7
MRVTWTATALGPSRRHCVVERDSVFRELADHFAELRSRGQGYLGARLSGSEFSRLVVGFRSDRAVIHLFDGAERSFLLFGDGSAATDAVVDVPIMDALATFSGDFVLTVDRPWALMNFFIRTGAPGELGRWCEL